MKINRKKLLTTLKKCLPGVEMGNSLLEGADTFVFSGPTIHSYNDAVSVSVNLGDATDRDLFGVVSGREFYDLVSQLPSDTVQLASKETGWILKAGSAKAELASRESRVPEMIAQLKLETLRWNELPENFNEGLKLCHISNNHSSLAGLAVSAKMMVASDGVRLSWFELADSMEQFWITDSAQKQLIALQDMKEYSVVDDWVHFRCEDGTMFSVKRLIDSDSDGKERFPFSRVSKILTDLTRTKTDPQGSFPKGFADVLNRAGIFAEDMEGFPAVQVEFTSTNVTVSSARSAGKFTERMKWAEELNLKEPLTIRMTYKYLTDALKKTDQFYVKSLDKSRQYIGLYSEGFLHIVATIISTPSQD